MGSGFIAYAVIMAIIMLAGEQWMRRSGRSPEFFDSSVITLWVCVNVFAFRIFFSQLVAMQGIGKLIFLI